VRPRFIIKSLFNPTSSVHCGDGAIDDPRILRRNDRGVVAVDAYGCVVGVAAVPIESDFRNGSLDHQLDQFHEPITQKTYPSGGEP
jgi:hypothetical protein